MSEAKGAEKRRAAAFSLSFSGAVRLGKYRKMMRELSASEERLYAEESDCAGVAKTTFPKIYDAAISAIKTIEREAYFSVEIDGEKKLFYIGAGMSELPEFYAEADGAKLRVYGSHGAKYKEKISAARGSVILGYAAEYADGEGSILISDGKYGLVIE